MKKIVKTFAFAVITFTVVACASQNNKASNNQRSTDRQGGPPNYAQILSEMDTNKDGKLAKSETKGPLANDFSTIDTNRDGYISEGEFKNAPRPQRGRSGQ